MIACRVAEQFGFVPSRISTLDLGGAGWPRFVCCSWIHALLCWVPIHHFRSNRYIEWVRLSQCVCDFFNLFLKRSIKIIIHHQVSLFQSHTPHWLFDRSSFSLDFPCQSFHHLSIQLVPCKHACLNFSENWNLAAERAPGLWTWIAKRNPKCLSTWRLPRT